MKENFTILRNEFEKIKQKGAIKYATFSQKTREYPYQTCQKRQEYPTRQYQTGYVN